MKRYWDYTEKERAEMTMEHVEALLSAELMAAGVVRVECPEMLPTEMPVIPGKTYYAVKSGYSTVRGIGFRNADEAAEAVKLMVPLDSDYIGGSDFCRESDRSDKISIEPIIVHLRSDIANYRSAVEKAAANKTANEAATNKYIEESKAVEGVLSGVWEDYRNCQRKLAELNKVIATFDEYVGICDGDDQKALVFLAKAFPSPRITEAMSWAGREMPCTDTGEDWQPCSKPAP